MYKIIFKIKHYIEFYLYKYFFSEKFQTLQSYRVKKFKSNENSLKGFDLHKSIFIHIPKAGGVSLNNNLYNSLGGGHRQITDYLKIYSPREFNDYYKFTIVRNPWDRLISAYIFLKNGGFNNVDKKWFKYNLSKYSNFEEFVKHWINSENVYRYIHFVPQFEFLYFGNYKCIDKIYHFENMGYVYDDLSRKLNIPIENKHKNKTIKKRNNYRYYYNNETKKIVGNVYKKDIDIFNYMF